MPVNIHEFVCIKVHIIATRLGLHNELIHYLAHVSEFI